MTVCYNASDDDKEDPKKGDHLTCYHCNCPITSGSAVNVFIGVVGAGKKSGCKMVVPSEKEHENESWNFHEECFPDFFAEQFEFYRFCACCGEEFKDNA